MTGELVALNGSPRLLDETGLRRTVSRLAHEVAEHHADTGRVVLVGIHTRGVPLALRLADTIARFERARPRVVAVDPRDFRDDRPRRPLGDAAVLSGVDGATAPPINDADVILVDDVLFTGRTQRAALDALLTAGRPAVVEMLVLVDRGHRELPLRATYVGKNVPTSSAERVAVRLREVDGVDGVWLQGTPS